jgi:hypothetical protein
VAFHGWIYRDNTVNVLDPTIWIADTEASVHSTSNLTLTTDWQNPTSKTVVVMGNGEKEKVVKSWCIKGIVKDKDNKNQGRMSLCKVVYLPKGKYNLFSVTKVMRSGWKLEGNKRIIFDFKIPTHNGCLSASKY